MSRSIHVDLNRCAPEGIVGWAVHPSGIEEIRVAVDDREIGAARIGLSRPDVAAAFQNAPHSDTAGFEYEFPARVLDVERAPAAVRIDIRAGDGTREIVRRTIAKRMAVPYPPFALINRVSAVDTQEDPLAAYDQMGAGCKASLLRVLPKEWAWQGKRVLDLGCGAGRLVRHFVEEAKIAARFSTCDIDGPSIDWLRANLSPPFDVARNGEEPPLPWDNETFDLVYAVSVFTHISDTWADWLLELHRVLAPEGLAILTIMSKGCYADIAGEPWDEHAVGMNTICCGNSWDCGGPMVFHSPWWIREHWGRLFDVLDLRVGGFGAFEEGSGGQGVVLLRRRPVAVSREELMRVHDDDSRELRALQHNVYQLKRETLQLRRQMVEFLRTAAAERDGLRGRLASAEAMSAYMRSSVSWRATAPLRSIRALLRASAPTA